jgi:uncharacterized protein (UPF0332 family)
VTQVVVPTSDAVEKRNGSVFDRARSAAKHFLAAVVFRESSGHTVETAGSALLASIGYYYAGFHLALGMLWLRPTVAPDDLRHVKHARLRRLVQEELVSSGHVDAEFLVTLKNLLKLREYANYAFGSKLPDYEVDQEVAKLYERTDPIFEIATSAMRKMFRDLDATSAEQCDAVSIFCAAIGDDFGSDLIRLHCAKPLAERVWAYILDKQFTT